MAHRKNNKNTPKHPKLPNGFGRITKINSKNLRKPFRAMITVGHNEEGKPIGKIVGYYESWYAAYDALSEYHKNPYDLRKQITTVDDLYQKWSKEYFEELTTTSSIRTVEAAWEYVTPTFRKQNAATIQPQALKEFINNDAKVIDDNSEKHASENTKARLKSMFNLMYDYAVLAGIISINPARQFTLKGIQNKIEKNRKEKNPITLADEKELWKDLDFGYTRMVLINIYSGWRPQELVLLKKDDIDLENNTIKGGMKTNAGTDRIIPIHPKIRSLIEYYYYKSEGEMLFYDYDSINPTKLTYDKYRRRFEKISDTRKNKELCL